MRKIGETALRDIVNGATLLGAGGGGSPKSGLDIVEKTVKASKEITLVKLEEVPDKSTVCVVAGMGSPEVVLKEGWRGEDVPAFERLEKIMGKKIDYVIPIETGGGNSITPIHTAAVKGLPVIDGDGVGRAIPELEMTMFYIHNIPIAPLALADPKGNSAVLYPTDAYMAEKMARAITTSFGMAAGLACHVMTGKQVKEAAIPDTLSLAEDVGRAIRESREKEKDPVKAVINAIDGFEIARGKVEKKTVEVKGGFDFGKVYVGNIRVDYKNENMIAWKKEKPIAIAPDYVCWMTTHGQPLTNADLKEGLELAVIGKKAHRRWRTPKALKVFAHVLEELGYTGKYIPIEKLQK